MSLLKLRPGQLVGRSGLDLVAPGATYGAPRIETHPRPDRPARPVALPAMVGATTKQIRMLVELMIVFFLPDDSGSMYGQWGDPTGIRYAAALSLLGLMERSGGGRAGVVHWGSNAPADLAVGPVAVKRGKKVLTAALTVPPSLGGTNLVSGLVRARELTPELGAEERAIYFCLSDGIEAVTPAMKAAIGSLPPGSVHMLLVDRSGGCDPAMEAAWRTVAFGSFVRLKTFDTKAMAEQLAQIFAAAIDLQMPTDTTVQKPKEAR
jgi:hypothetical protein